MARTKKVETTTKKTEAKVDGRKTKRPEDTLANTIAKNLKGINQSAEQLGLAVKIERKQIYSTVIKVGMENNFDADQIARMIDLVSNKMKETKKTRKRKNESAD